MLTFFAWVAALVGEGAEAPRPAYAEGQIWQYRTRAGDEDSRLKIGRIEIGGAGGGEPIYHISIAGVDLGRADVKGLIQHVPVSKGTLDASVVRLADANGLGFGDVEEGIAEWRRADGGVFAISVAEIVEIMAQMLATPPPEAGRVSAAPEAGGGEA